MSGTVGVLIRTLNESGLIGRCLETLASQQSEYELDVLVLDSGSTDDTLEIARAHGARIYEMAPEDFDYSRSLNVGIGEVAGDLILVLSAHAAPLDDQWVARMRAPFADPRVAGVTSRQVPWPGHPFREVRWLASTFASTPRTWSRGDDGAIFRNAACARPPQRVAAAPVHAPRGREPRLGAARDHGRLDEPGRRKLAHLRGLLQMVFYCVMDFSRPESTAVLRRQRSS